MKARFALSLRFVSSCLFHVLVLASLIQEDEDLDLTLDDAWLGVNSKVGSTLVVLLLADFTTVVIQGKMKHSANAGIESASKSKAHSKSMSNKDAPIQVDDESEDEKEDERDRAAFARLREEKMKEGKEIEARQKAQETRVCHDLCFMLPRAACTDIFRMTS